MNLKAKNFIRRKLIPFILREEGRGFAMSTWQENENPGQHLTEDDITRKVPKCGTVACIGGSLQALSDNKIEDERGLGRMIGLTPAQTFGLFYEWEEQDGMNGYISRSHAWPISFRNEFAKAKTTLGKAKVAVKLLRKIAKDGGGILKVKREDN